MPAQPSRKAPDPTGSDPTGSAPAAVAPGALRADARKNRERILRAAREAYAVDGLDVPMTTIARRAGVGPATLYRHFPSRVELITAVFAGQFAQCVAAFEEAFEDPDPWHGLCSFLDKVCAEQAADRGFGAAFLGRFPGVIDIESEREGAEAGLARLVRRAKDAGQLRQDFDPSDIILLLLANVGLAGQSPQVSPAASRRLVAYLLQSFRAGRTDPLPPPAPLTLRQIQHAGMRGPG
ncbi:TetR/AcrR family transcriptional regulator [Streptomyces sp. IB2014 016-6]|uniref:TetR/AcrR family transcriptional regulator n=1 Tax=Streptomyces sp. IB2014 016-6 TaxID=2517818 RepID=UPI0011C84098|nr:TetR/AcrR family transcriptional regulator [Streptomyces sp. IB2014 016-6]TXL89204.1 TetR/AcrR family transcriptional regulator [Streptomyces sp. IB2014 016-6]